MMLSNCSPVYQKRNRGAKSGVAATPAPVPPTEPPVLMVANYATAANVVLTFDVPIDITQWTPSAVVVFDAVDTMQQFAGVSGVLIDEMTVQIDLTAVGDAEGDGVTMNIAVGNGIAAAGGGPVYGGYDGVELPYDQ